MQIRWVSGVSSAVVFVLLAAIACNSEEPSDGDTSEGGSGGSDDGSGGDPDDGSGGRAATGGGASGGAGGDSTNQGGEGGDTNEPECVEPPDDLVYWWNQVPFELPVPPALWDKAREVVSGHHGSIHGSSYEISEQFVGYAFEFEEETDIVADSPSDPTTHAVEHWTAASLEFWFSTQVDDTNLASFHSSWAPGANSWGVRLVDGRLNLFLRKSDRDAAGPDTAQTFQVTTVSRYSDGNPHHVAVTHDTEALLSKLYVDGELEVTFDFGAAVELETPGLEGYALFEVTAALGHPLWMGGHDYQDWFVGMLDEVSVYGTPLSADDVRAIYQAGSAGKCLPE